MALRYAALRCASINKILATLLPLRRCTWRATARRITLLRRYCTLPYYDVMRMPIIFRRAADAAYVFTCIRHYTICNAAHTIMNAPQIYNVAPCQHDAAAVISPIFAPLRFAAAAYCRHFSPAAVTADADYAATLIRYFATPRTLPFSLICYYARRCCRRRFRRHTYRRSFSQ